MEDLSEISSVMTDKELYQLHLEAAGFPTKKYGGKVLAGYKSSFSRRVLTLIDTIIWLSVATLVVYPLVIMSALILMLCCVFNISAGPISFGAYLYYWWLDRIPAPIPSPEVLATGSPESLSLVAEYIMSPVLRATQAFINRCESERAQVDNLIITAEEVEQRVNRERSGQKESSLLPLYDEQLNSARQALIKLTTQRDQLLSRERAARDQIERIEQQLGDMRVLAHASFQLRVVLDRVSESTQELDEERARRTLRNLCDQMDRARDKVHSMQNLAIARARAAAEVDHMMHVY